MSTSPTSPPSLCAACHIGEPHPHCETQRGCSWSVCGTCDAVNDGAGHYNFPRRHVGNHRAVLEWAAKYGIKADFIERTH